jgi:hypothetical protein
MSVDRIMLRNPSPVLAALSTITQRHTPAREGGEPHLVIRRTDELEVTAYFGVGPNDHATYFVGIDDGSISVEAPETGLFISLEDADAIAASTPEGLREQLRGAAAAS